MGKQQSPHLYQIAVLHSEIEQRLRQALHNLLIKNQLDYRTWLILSVVTNASKRGLSMTQIGKQLGISLPQVTVAYNALLGQKLVKQKTASTDHRRRLLVSTVRGKRLAQKLQQETDVVLDDLPPEELEIYIKTQHILAENLA